MHTLFADHIRIQRKCKFYWKLNAGNIQSILISLSSLFFFLHSIAYEFSFFLSHSPTHTQPLLAWLSKKITEITAENIIRAAEKLKHWNEATPNGKKAMLFQFIFDGVSALSCSTSNRCRLKITQPTVKTRKRNQLKEGKIYLSSLPLRCFRWVEYSPIAFTFYENIFFLFATCLDRYHIYFSFMNHSPRICVRSLSLFFLTRWMIEAKEIFVTCRCWFWFKLTRIIPNDTLSHIQDIFSSSACFVHWPHFRYSWWLIAINSAWLIQFLTYQRIGCLWMCVYILDLDLDWK